jgi:hypothetical protein
MTGLYGFALKIVAFALFGSVLPQSSGTPLTKEAVTSLFGAEKGGAAVLKDQTKGEVERLGVDFELDPKTEQEFRVLGMDQALLTLIRNRARITALTVQCEPVECEVTIYDEVVGTTVAARLTKSPVKPGLVPIKVSARGFETGRMDVPVSPGEHSTAARFKMEPLKGGLDVTCERKMPVIGEPLVCGISLVGPNGLTRKGVTKEGRFTLDGLPIGEYDIEATAPPCHLSATAKTWVVPPDVRTQAFQLEPDEWGCKTESQVYDAIVDSLGGKTIFTAGTLAKNTARMRLAGDPPSIGMLNGVQVTEYVAPNRLRWDMRIAATRWNVIYDGTTVGSSGDKNRYGGKEFAQELEFSIRLFSMLRLPYILSRIHGKFDMKKGAPLELVASSADERFTFRLREDYSPLKVVYERLTAPRSIQEMEFEQFKSIGQDLILPHVMVLKYPDRPKHEHSFEYDKIDISPPARTQIKEDVFKVPK